MMMSQRQRSTLQSSHYPHPILAIFSHLLQCRLPRTTHCRAYLKFLENDHIASSLDALVKPFERLLYAVRSGTAGLGGE
ncbi:hypothetical protein ONZ45_g18893 [Pleurotus djamor]|nr:hypothetical protein ONZ45_g18893 [Pleurotus djamor]